MSVTDVAPAQRIPSAVFLGLPDTIALSPSRASDFVSCPLKFRFRTIDRFPERPSPAAVRGTLVHAVLENLFDLPAPERTLESAQELLGPTWEQLAADDPALTYAIDPYAEFPCEPGEEPAPSPAVVASWLTGAEPLLETYFGLEDPTRLEPRERELKLEVELSDGLKLKGIVDRIDVAPGDLIRVVDYKTGRSPGPSFEQKPLFQMRFYALMMLRVHGVMPKRLQLMYLGDGEVITYDPNPEELVAFERTLRALWKAITRAAETGDWRPRESKLCDWCDHHDKCPAKGGTVPPLPAELATHLN